MKIAFDCKGTLLGPNQDKVVRLFHTLQGLQMGPLGTDLSDNAIKTLAMVVNSYELAHEVIKLQRELIENSEKCHKDVLAQLPVFKSNFKE
jgi:hypothetical protein